MALNNVGEQFPLFGWQLLGGKGKKDSGEQNYESSRERFLDKTFAKN